MTVITWVIDFKSRANPIRPPASFRFENLPRKLLLRCLKRIKSFCHFLGNQLPYYSILPYFKCGVFVRRLGTGWMHHDTYPWPVHSRYVCRNLRKSIHVGNSSSLWRMNCHQDSVSGRLCMQSTRPVAQCERYWDHLNIGGVEETVGNKVPEERLLSQMQGYGS